MTKVISFLSMLAVGFGCSTSDRFVAVANQSLDKVVKITVPFGKKGAEGAGVLISSRGHILTVAHLFHENHGVPSVILKYGETIYPATVIHIEKDLDLALIKVEAFTPRYAQIARLTDTQVGQDVIAIGHPLGLYWTVTHGIISKIGEDSFLYDDFTQTDAPISPGNSGGPLFNVRGKLVGINSHIATTIAAPVQIGLNMAASLSSIYKFLDIFRGL